jgi:hypothetical protein
VRYCIVRHVGFLVGLGRPAGDAEAPVQTVDQVIALLRRPIPSADELTAAFDRLHANEKAALSKLETQVETDLFDALTALFVDPARSGRARKALTAAVGESTFEILAAYLAFIRTAHYWTETHPELAFEPDMVRLMEGRPDLASLVLDASDAELVKAKQDVRQVTSQLHRAERALRDSEIRLEGQAGAFRAAVGGEPPAVSLDALVETVDKYTDGQARCAFYLANKERTEMRHITGMPESYAHAV